MNSRDIEDRVMEAERVIGALHSDLVDAGETALLQLPCISAELEPNTNELVCSVMLGESPNRT